MLRKMLIGCSVLVVVAAMGCPIVVGGPTFFLVADPSNPDLGSYVLPLTNQTDIDHARAVIADPEGTDNHIVVANIARGGTINEYVSGKYANRDLVNDGAIWSWHVQEFLRFADATAEIYDGSPVYVENHLDDWFTNTGGIIGFWGFLVTREVSSDEVAL